MVVGPSISIIGLGGVGALVAASAERVGVSYEVILPKSSQEKYCNQRIYFKSQVIGNGSFSPALIREQASEDTQLVIICVKSYQIDGVIECLIHTDNPNRIYLPLLNGFGHFKKIESKLKQGKTIWGMFQGESYKTDALHLVQTSKEIGIRIHTSSELENRLFMLHNFLDQLQGIGFKIYHDSSPQHVVWNKLARLNTLALVTSLAGMPLGSILGSEIYRVELETLLNENIKIAQSQGVHLDFSDQMQIILNLPKEFRTSMARDFTNKQLTEFGFCLDILVLARENGIPIPIMEKYVQRLKEMGILWKH